jgi:hypothetical protein
MSYALCVLQLSLVQCEFVCTQELNTTNLLVTPPPLSGTVNLLSKTRSSVNNNPPTILDKTRAA